MPKDMKYIITRDITFGEIPIIFDSVLPHTWWLPMYRGAIISAGFLQFCPTIQETTEARCYGRSESLNINSRPEQDSILITKRMNPYF